ncbi:hypothetical protein AB0G60_09325 [Streptomyces angustmyceticus]|uniref:Uncharacterized protein n=1 Tax=Streptomyces angustmyceticus TaxID=285578 RepID=A0A5J4LG20_9ACTN|nr:MULTISPECIES: hypothetical protein [Streptomyces]UAL67870.1 hypothetical protein K7396_16170 [Streptomyces angustmyceticus]WSK35650.1 hypothetical protein OG761_16275 [Streptomyces tubercidicus]GES31002.1 hypothetical protein San01_34890 [Streptomyces angustmyceticus]
MAIPREIEMEIVRRLYEEAADKGWTYLTDRERTEIYNRWVRSHEIGERLALYLKDSEGVRYWLKDCPMKEYSRAVYGIGKYAKVVSNPRAGVDTLVKQTMGSEWVADLGTRRIKPLRVTLRNGEEDTHFTWGPQRDLKHLVWAALRAEADGDPTPWTVCVVSSFVAPIPIEEKHANLRLGERCGLRIEHATGE